MVDIDYLINDRQVLVYLIEVALSKLVHYKLIFFDNIRQNRITGDNETVAENLFFWP